jgi:hypothetical protein
MRTIAQEQTTVLAEYLPTQPTAGKNGNPGEWQCHSQELVHNSLRKGSGELAAAVGGST